MVSEGPEERGSSHHWTRYLKEFRTEQCPLFVQHKCSQHRPYTCFHWHFVNQRRRRSVRRRDGTFNYSPDIYCTKYDETTGLCPEGDDCPFLHRTTGDTERRYHLRYYKTGICIHETDAKGNCTKNGLHCAFAHGPHDLRSPVYDIRELQAMEALQNGQPTVDGSIEGQSAVAASHAMIEKILGEEPRWQDTMYVLGNYKTEQCKKPPRLCRQGYACPYYHNSKDRRRGPRKHKYRSSPCPSVKHGDEWGDPSKCDHGDGCQYCHTRTEQQFHPEIYKSTKCNDMQQSGSCPRGPFCAFAHVEQTLLCEDLQSSSAVSSPTQTGPIMYMPSAAGDSVPVSPSSTHAPDLGNIICSTGSFGSPSNICGSPPGIQGNPHSWENICLPADTTGTAAGNYKKAPGFEREDQVKIKPYSVEHRSQEQPFLQPKQDVLGIIPLGSPLASSISSSITSSLATTPPSPAGISNIPGMNANALPFYPTSDTVESVIESALDDLDLNEFGVAALEKSFDSSAPHSSGIMRGGNLLQSSAPVNIPGSLGSSASFHSASPSPPVSLSSQFLPQHQGHTSQSDSTFLGTSSSHGSLDGARIGTLKIDFVSLKVGSAIGPESDGANKTAPLDEKQIPRQNSTIRSLNGARGITCTVRGSRSQSTTGGVDPHESFFERLSCLAPRWRGPYQVLLVTQTSVRVAGRKNWIHATHTKRIPQPVPYNTEDTESLCNAVTNVPETATTDKRVSETVPELVRPDKTAILSPHSPTVVLPDHQFSDPISVHSPPPVESDDALLSDPSAPEIVKYNLRPRK
ncbi:RING finger protein unkempt homolog isoform X2 [Ambystoma mexicanum]|uniref:RING finger protein unkempt homolog isoform X2 n=1 Tax=Ambystoma mexicanum TaxID=8296 RepID=UPI0037E7955D